MEDHAAQLGVSSAHRFDLTQVLVEGVGQDVQVVSKLGPAVRLAGAVVHLRLHPAAVALFTKVSACWQGTSMSAWPWMMRGKQLGGDAIPRRVFPAQLLSTLLRFGAPTEGGFVILQYPHAHRVLSGLAAIEKVRRREEAPLGVHGPAGAVRRILRLARAGDWQPP